MPLRHNRADIAEAIRKEFDLLGVELPPAIHEQIVVVRDIADLLPRARAVRRAICGNVVGASAGNYSFVQLWNPPDSGIDVILERFWLNVTTDTTVYWSWQNDVIGTPGVRVWSDRRLPGYPGAVLNGHQQAAAWGNIIATCWHPGYAIAGQIEFNFEFILGPGMGVHWYPNVQNKGINVIAQWREEDQQST